MTMTDESVPAEQSSRNYTIDPKTGHIIYEGDWYFPIDQVSKRRPLVTGAPKITYQKHYIWLGKNKLLNKPMIGIFKTSNECSIYRVINYNVQKEGGLQFALIGQYGFAKSTIMSTIQANLLARKHRILQFDNMAMECQKLAFHGYFTKDGNFHPFKIIIWIPAGYQFDTEAQNYKPMIRNNVIVKQFRKTDEIIDEMKPHVLNSVFKDAFDSASFLRLFMDLINEISRRTTRDKSYMLAMHEFANLFPEGSSGDVYKNIRLIALEALRNIRKWNIGMLASFHKPYDVAYFIGQKFNMIGQVRPFPQKTLSPLEKVARNYKRGDIAIAAGSHYRKHHIDELPTAKTIYVYNANPIVYYYDSERGPIDQLTLALQLEMEAIRKQEELEEQKRLALEKKKQDKLLDYDLKKKQYQEKLENQEYVREQELQFKKELEEFKAKQKQMLQEKENQQKKELEELKLKQKEQDLLAKQLELEHKKEIEELKLKQKEIDAQTKLELQKIKTLKKRPAKQFDEEELKKLIQTQLKDNPRLSSPELADKIGITNTRLVAKLRKNIEK